MGGKNSPPNHFDIFMWSLADDWIQPHFNVLFNEEVKQKGGVFAPPRETQLCFEPITQNEHFIIGRCNCTENAKQADLEAFSWLQMMIGNQFSIWYLIW